MVRIIARLNVGGPAQHVVNLTRDLRDRFPTTLVAGPVEPHEADMSGLAEREQVPIIMIPELGRSVRPWSDLVALGKLWRLIRRHRPAIVHTHTAKAGTLGRVAALLAGVPIRVHTYHGHVFHGYFSPWKTRLFLTIERVLARFTTRIVVISPAQAEEISGFLGVPQAALAIVPLGLDLERFRQGDPVADRRTFREAIGAAADAVVVSVVGRLVPIKNHGLAIRALARVAARHPQLRLVFVGGGEEEARLRALSRSEGVGDQVAFAGWWTDLSAVYRGSEAVALTSDNEGTPVCLLEALACGLPIVATEVGGVRDILAGGRYGQLVPAGDEVALGSALSALMDPMVRARWRNVAVDETIARYGAARLARDIGALYDELLARR